MASYCRAVFTQRGIFGLTHSVAQAAHVCCGTPTLVRPVGSPTLLLVDTWDDLQLSV